MKTYVRFIAFTISLGIAFGTAYLTQMALDVQTDWWASTVTACKYVPPATVFKYAVPCLRALTIVLLTPSVATRRLRNTLPLLVSLGLLDIIWCYVFSVLRLTYLAIGICVMQLAILFVLTSFYIRNSKILWAVVIPVDVAYIFATVLNVIVLIP